jgi:hypothetical protein
VPPPPDSGPSVRQIAAALLELGADALRLGARAATGRAARQPAAPGEHAADVDEALPGDAATAPQDAIPGGAVPADDAISGDAVAAATAQPAAAAAAVAALGPSAANEPSPAADGETAAARIDDARERLRARIVAPTDEDRPPQSPREREEGP